MDEDCHFPINETQSYAQFFLNIIEPEDSHVQIMRWSGFFASLIISLLLMPQLFLALSEKEKRMYMINTNKNTAVFGSESTI